MPIQMWTPMVQADTTSIANGISEAGRGIGQGLAMRAADMKRREEADKRKAEGAKKIRGMAKMFQEDIGLSESEVQSLDADELGGMVEGYMLSQSSKHQKLQQERDALTIAGMKMLQRDAEGRKGIPKQLVEGFESRGREIPSPTSNEGFDQQLTQSTGMPTGVRELIQAHANAGQELPPGIMDDIIRQQGGGATDWENLKPREGKTASGRPYIYGKGGQFQFEQTDLNPDGIKERTLSDGTVQAWNGKQWANASRPQRVPTDFTTKLGEMAAGFDDPKYGASAKASVKTSIDTAHTLKQLDDTQRDSLYEQFGFSKGKGGAAPAKATTGTTPSIRTQKEYDALNSGDLYIDAATGKTKKKK